MKVMAGSGGIDGDSSWSDESSGVGDGDGNGGGEHILL